MTFILRRYSQQSQPSVGNLAIDWCENRPLSDAPTSIGLFCHSSSCVNRCVKSASQLPNGRRLGQARFAHVAGT